MFWTIHPKVLNVMVEVHTKSLSVIYQQLWLAREALVDWRLADMPPGDRKGWKDFPGSYRPDLGIRTGYGAGNPECCDTAPVGQYSTRI